jgi:hypothetical protein
MRCHTDTCPTGVATQDPALVAGLDVADKRVRVANYQTATVHAFSELISAAGLAHPHDLRPWHILRRISPTEVRHYGEIFQYLEAGELLGQPTPPAYARAWLQAQAETFAPAVSG